jgi:hypothetical protein
MSPNEYWENYRLEKDFDALSPNIPSQQRSFTSESGLQRAGYDPVWIYTTFGDKLKLLPAELYDAVFNAMRNGEILSPHWAAQAALFLPELET